MRLVQTFSPAKLFLVLELSRRRQVRLEARALINATAAAAGGKAALDRYKQLEREMRGGNKPKAGGGSEIPLSQADFEAMMQEETE